MLTTLTALRLERQGSHDHDQEGESTEATDTNHHHPLDNPHQVVGGHAEEENTTSGKGDQELVDTLYTAKDQWGSGLNLLPRLLRTACYVFGRTRGTVVPVVLHHWHRHSEDVVKKINDLHRLLMCIAAHEYGKSLEYPVKLTVSVRPHKVRMVNGIRVQDCWTARSALIIKHLPRSTSEEATELSYSYIGGGTAYDPPNTYGLVSKRMPLAMADTFLALILFLRGGSVDPQMFIRTAQTQLRQTVSPEEATKDTTERVQEVQQRLQNLHQTYQTPTDLLTRYGLSQQQPSTPQNVSQPGGL